jgi:hypothetical protein
MQVYARPFTNKTADWMEFFSLVATFITFFCGQMLCRRLRLLFRCVLTHFLHSHPVVL